MYQQLSSKEYRIRAYARMLNACERRPDPEPYPWQVPKPVAQKKAKKEKIQKPESSEIKFLPDRVLSFN